jgi:hypothetical protein
VRATQAAPPLLTAPSRVAAAALKSRTAAAPAAAAAKSGVVAAAAEGRCSSERRPKVWDGDPPLASVLMVFVTHGVAAVTKSFTLVLKAMERLSVWLRKMKTTKAEKKI